LFLSATWLENQRHFCAPPPRIDSPAYLLYNQYQAGKPPGHLPLSIAAVRRLVNRNGISTFLEFPILAVLA